MITREYRSLTEKEIKNLRAGHKWLHLKLSDFFGILFITLVFYVGGGWCLGRAIDWLVFTAVFGNKGRVFFTAVLPLLGLVVAAVSLIRGELSRRRALEAVEKSLEKTLSDGREEILRCGVTRAAELSEYEDEGPGYFLEISPNLLLFLQGQYLMEFEHFPSASVTVTRVVQTHAVLEVQYSGDPVVLCRRIESRRFGGVAWLEDGLIFHGNIDEIPSEISTLPPKSDALDETLQTKV